MCNIWLNTNNNAYANIDYSVIEKLEIKDRTEQEAIEILKKARWGLYDKPICVNCGSSNISIMQRSDAYFCRPCAKQFKEFSKTVLARNKMNFSIKLNIIIAIIKGYRIVDLDNKFSSAYLTLHKTFHIITYDYALYKMRTHG